jgi:hypothetical protein
MRVLTKTLALTAVAVFLLIGLVPPGLYWLGLANIDGRPEPPHARDTQRRDYDFVGNLKFPHPIVVRKLSPWSYPFLVANEDPAIWIVAGSYNVGHLKRRENLWWGLSGAALIIWLSRNWSEDQIVSAAAMVVRSSP